LEQYGEWKDLGWEWDFKWRREWFDWEKPMIEELFGIIQQSFPKKEMQGE